MPKSIPKSDAQVIREVMIEKGLATAEDFEAKRAGWAEKRDGGA